MAISVKAARGDVAEQMVCLELLKRGMSVLVPRANTAPYDLAVDLGDGKIARIQVRWAYYCKKPDSYAGKTWTTHLRKCGVVGSKMSSQDVDFCIFVVKKLGVYYIVPISVLESAGVFIVLIPHRPRLKIKGTCYEVYLDRWDLLLERVSPGHLLAIDTDVS